MNHHSLYGEFYYSESAFREDLQESHGWTGEELDGAYEVLDVVEVDYDQYEVEGHEGILSWDDIQTEYISACAICDATDGGPEIVQIVVSR